MEDLNCRENCKICALESFMSPEWKRHLLKEFTKDYFINIKRQLHKNIVFYPSIANIFSFSHYFDIKDTKVVILGQDPYHGKNQANGLAFSVNPGVKQLPSLRNILKEVINNFKDTEANKENLKLDCINSLSCTRFRKNIFLNGDLTGWAAQNVLLLNNCLTVEENKPNSHKKLGWDTLTNHIIELVSKECTSVVFMLWGSFAHSKEKFIDKDKHLIVKAPHPSPFSCYKGFFGCNHFKIANEYLKANCKEEIDWFRI